MGGIRLIYNKRRCESVCIPLPLSKSMAARALIISAFAGSKYPVEPFCTDTAELSRAIAQFLELIPRPRKRILAINTEIVAAHFNLGLGGTSLRFFIPLVASMPGLVATVTCDEALRHRPLLPLCEGLEQAGITPEFLADHGYPPLRIEGRRVRGGDVRIAASSSSQFASALMMAAPYWDEGIHLRFSDGGIVSESYLRMTAEMMMRSGADVSLSAKGVAVAPGGYAPEGYVGKIEGDWSSAAFFYELALLCPGREIRLSGLVPPGKSVQGDSRCVEIFGLFGVETFWNQDGEACLKCDFAKRELMTRLDMPIELDMSSVPDLVPALAVGLCLAGIQFQFTGVSHLVHKESDRLTVLKLELEKIGYAVETGGNSIAWKGGRTPTGENETIETYGDHRIAMAFAMAAAVMPYLSINDPEVVAKSYPSFFHDLESVGFELSGYGGMAL